MISRSQSRKPPSIHDWKLHENIASRRSLLAARDLMAGVAKLAEQVMMHDLSPEMWNQIDTTKPEAAIASLRASLCCREPSTRLAVDKVGDTFMLPEEQAAACPVRKLRAEQAVQLKRAFKARVVEWIDTGVGNEKPAVVMRWRYNRSPPSSSASSADSDGGGEEDLIVVSFRGSKTLRDIFLVDAMSPIFHVPVPPAAEEQPPAGNMSMRQSSLARGTSRASPHPPSSFTQVTAQGVWCTAMTSPSSGRKNIWTILQQRWQNGGRSKSEG